jgi:hypothetical protein
VAKFPPVNWSRTISASFGVKLMPNMAEKLPNVFVVLIFEISPGSAEFTQA